MINYFTNRKINKKYSDKRIEHSTPVPHTDPIKTGAHKPSIDLNRCFKSLSANII